MTDNDIMNALKRCAEDDMNCKGCPLWKDSNCSSVLCRAALALINRQNAEIERLEEILGGTSKVLTETCAVVRAEAIKDFAENLIRNVTLNNTNDGYLDYAVDYYCLIEDINGLVKEMEGEG